MTQSEHIYAICCRVEVVVDVISGEHVKTIDGCAVLNFEVARSSSSVILKAGKPTNWWGQCETRRHSSLLSIMLAITCSVNVHA